MADPDLLKELADIAPCAKCKRARLGGVRVSQLQRSLEGVFEESLIVLHEGGLAQVSVVLPAYFFVFH